MDNYNTGKKLAITFGIVFIIIGLLGFVSNPIVGSQGFFLTDAIHNIIHLLLGVILLLAIGTERSACSTIRIIAVVYLILAIVGFVQFGNTGQGELLGLALANSADNWLHLVLAILLYGSAMLWCRRPRIGTEGPMM